MDKTKITLTLKQLIIATAAFFGALAGFLFFIVSLIRDDFAKTTQDHWEQRYAVIYNDQKKLAEESEKLFHLYKQKFPNLFKRYNKES